MLLNGKYLIGISTSHFYEGGIAMVRELIHDPIFLAGKSETATINDLQIAKDLLETLMAH